MNRIIKRKTKNKSRR